MFCDKLGTEIFTWTHSFARNSDVILVQGFCFLLAQWVPVFRTRYPAGYFWPNSDHRKMTFHILDWCFGHSYTRPLGILRSCYHLAYPPTITPAWASLSLDWRSTAAFFEPVCERDMLMRMIFKSWQFFTRPSKFRLPWLPLVFEREECFASAKKLLSECFRQECHDIVGIVVRLWESLLACSPLVRLSSCGTLLPTGFWCSVSIVFLIPSDVWSATHFRCFRCFLYCFWVLNFSLSRFWAAKTFLPPLLRSVSVSVRRGPRAIFFCDGLGSTVQWLHDWAASVWRFESFGLFGSVAICCHQMNKIVWQVAKSFWALSFLPNHSTWVYQPRT